MPVQLCLGCALVCYVENLQKGDRLPQSKVLTFAPRTASGAVLKPESGPVFPPGLTLIVLSEEQVAMRRP